MEKGNIGLDKNIFCDDKKCDLSQGKCISTDLTANCETVVLFGRHKTKPDTHIKLSVKTEELRNVKEKTVIS